MQYCLFWFPCWEVWENERVSPANKGISWYVINEVMCLFTQIFLFCEAFGRQVISHRWGDVKRKLDLDYFENSLDLFNLNSVFSFRHFVYHNFAISSFTASVYLRCFICARWALIANGPSFPQCSRSPYLKGCLVGGNTQIPESYQYCPC